MSGIELPPGFRFHPTDEELVTHYLCRKCASKSISVPIIAEIDLYKFNPWDLPGLALYGEKEWYFFSPRDRKYPNGSRPNRSAASGYWKATGADKPIGVPNPVGIKKALVFYSGKAPKGEKTNWIMHEYRLADVDRSPRKKKKNSLRLDDWVLCRIYNKKGALERRGQPPQPLSSSVVYSGVDDEVVEEKPRLTEMGMPPPLSNDFVYFETSDSVPKLHTMESSCSEHVVVSPEFTSEVQSNPKWKDWSGAANDCNTLDFGYNYIDATLDNAFVGGGSSNQLFPLQDMFMYMHKPY
ncbi:unnamed protein product [Cochlearia groenlandica]